MWQAFDNSIGELPIRRIDFDSAEDDARYAAVVRLASDIEQAARAAREGLSSSDRSFGARRAEALQEQLDELVLDLYDVTDSEVRASVLALGAPFD
jgi:hypothetical protein